MRDITIYKILHQEGNTVAFSMETKYAKNLFYRIINLDFDKVSGYEIDIRCDEDGSETNRLSLEFKDIDVGWWQKERIQV